MKHKENWLNSAVLELLAENDIQGLENVLNSPEYDIVTRRHAVIALGETGNKEAIPPLIDALHHEDIGVRMAAPPALADIGLPALEPMINALKEIEDGKCVERMAKSAFREMGKPAVKRLIESLTDEKPLLRNNAAQVLGVISDKTAVRALIYALKDENTDVRSSAVYALGDLGDADAVEPLIGVINTEVEEVREAAASALGNIGDSRAVEALIKALDDDEGFMTDSMAIGSLGKIGDKRAVEPLIAKLTDADVMTKIAVARALIDMGGEKGLTALRQFIKDREAEEGPNVEWALKKILKKQK